MADFGKHTEGTVGELLGEKGHVDWVDPVRLFGGGKNTALAQQHIDVVSADVKDAADTVFTMVPGCPEKTLAMRHLELAGYYAHAALAREGMQTEEDGGFVEVDRRQNVRKRVEGMIGKALMLTKTYLAESWDTSAALVEKLVAEKKIELRKE